eukprot:CAMPEP_0202451096 /NCGR_PEP_ID=MMETSP1360-20130828/9591_1 /ASSEMBLY_ACC=CAM_ASM_000848 /TAXON_ID=515479 /ORGANISM="Licmophora paradoxa, Strain CCMP2313" /LENGTH=241 /DNA_ID=CAMNT_0049069565 /DNA_START=478 /DNA_END=1203 /DNA_ORIENTATION=+
MTTFLNPPPPSPSCQLSIIILLLSIFPDSADIRDGRGMVPWDYIDTSHPRFEKIQTEFERGRLCWKARDIYDPKGNPTALHICQRKWDDARERLQRYPEEATVWTKHKNLRYLPIHYACKYKAPPGVVQELIDIHPFSLALTCQDFDMTALHLACQGGNLGVGVIQALIEGHRDACSHEDALGLLPLHLACAAGASVAVVQALLRAYPEAADHADSKGYRPRVYAEAASYPHSKQVLEMLR